MNSDGSRSILKSLIRGVKLDKRQIPSLKQLEPKPNQFINRQSIREIDQEIDFFGCNQTQEPTSIVSSTQPPAKPANVSSQPASETREQKTDPNYDLLTENDPNDSQTIKLFPNLITTSTSKPEINTKKQREDEQASIALFRRQMGIRVEGSYVPNPIETFENIPSGQNDKEKHFRSIILHNIEASEYKDPTAIQMQAIPSMLAGRDVLGTAPTGSGKTAAFLIPILMRLARTHTQASIRSIIVSPTRELAVQIQKELRQLTVGYDLHSVVLSKTSAVNFSEKPFPKIDILIATPLRLVHLIQQAKVDLSGVEVITLDEADRLFELGFIDQIDEIIASCTFPDVQRTMFSATMLQGVEEAAISVLRDPHKIAVGVKNSGAKSIDQKLMFVGKEEGKLVAMKQLGHIGLQIPALLFVQNKERVDELYQELLYDGIHVGAIHADRSQMQRDQVLREFRAGKIWVLICTDLICRGLDFKAVNMVINYDFPQSAISYIHRIGRTGRNGRKGFAVTFFTERDMQFVRPIANVIKLSGQQVPAWMLSLKKPSNGKRQHLLKAPPKRQHVTTVSAYDLQKAHKRIQMKKRHQNRSQALPSTN
uniref:RNA helicase n=1 Tax=Albugo laibachii Nc14 TaxID=890382 RepID=F0W0B0_9STRA|nr:DEAD/DEAH box RNA helicase putative [Albugo laibachii Nc14]|eukprot:CCA14481.1 DEAD/DEAH box RNA helicase putative [Albugo laibachii Nc14]